MGGGLDEEVRRGKLEKKEVRGIFLLDLMTR